MPYRYYIVDPTGGDIWGTDSTDIAEDFSQSDDHYVIDAHQNEWIQMGTIGERSVIPEYKA